MEFSLDDIASIDHWDYFNLNKILNDYGQVLYETLCTGGEIPQTLAAAVHNNHGLKEKWNKYLRYPVQASLRAAFDHM